MIPNEYPTLDFDLGETADMLRGTVQSFTSDEITPIAAEIDQSNEFPRQLWPKLGELGLLGITVGAARRILSILNLCAHSSSAPSLSSP